jgi:hypothetical protein
MVDDPLLRSPWTCRLTGGSRNPLKFGGVFHAGIEVFGREWSFGATLEPSDAGDIRDHVPARCLRRAGPCGGAYAC